MRTFMEVEDQAELATWSSDVNVAREAHTPWPVEDSAVTAPFVRALELEGPTTIFDRAPPERTARGSSVDITSGFERAVTEEELGDSYEAALKKFV